MNTDNNMNTENNFEQPWESAEIEKELKYIKYAWITTAVSAVLTVIVSFLSTYSADIKYGYGINLWALIDAALVAGLAYGIYRKNRYCALSMFIYFTVSKLALFSTGNMAGLSVSLLFIMIFFREWSRHFVFITTGLKLARYSRRQDGGLNATWP